MPAVLPIAGVRLLGGEQREKLRVSPFGVRSELELQDSTGRDRSLELKDSGPTLNISI